MLITKASSLSIGSIISCKLQNGQELVGRLNFEDTSTVLLGKPLLVELARDPATNEIAITMMPGFVLSADWDQSFSINRSHITTMTTASASIQKEYATATSSIAMPLNGILR